MQREYIIAFSSFYKAAYGQDVLAAKGLKATLKKLPIEIAKSCSTGLYYNGNEIEKVKAVLEDSNISTRGIYFIDRDSEKKTKYRLVK